MSKARNQRATTAAPITPAMMPSRKIGASGRAMAGFYYIAGGLDGSVTREAHAVVGVAEMRRQGRAVSDGAPWIGVAPGTAAAHAPSARSGPDRVPRGRVRIVGLLVPVGAPLVAHTGEVTEA